MKKITSLVALLVCVCLYGGAQTIITDSVIQTGTCAGSTIIVRFHTTGSFGSGNRFTAQLSNGFGQFTAPVNIGTVNYNIGLILATLPANASFGVFYRVRVVSSNPVVTGSESLNTVIVTSTSLTATINAQNGTVVCPGRPVTLTATLPNATYLWSTGATTQAITVHNAGTYSVKVTDPLGCDARDTVVVSQVANCITGIYGLPVTGTSMYPNPVTAGGLLHLKGLPAGIRKLQLLQADGKSFPVSFVSNSQVVDLSRYAIAPGMYTVLLSDHYNFRVVGKLLVR